MNRGIRVTYPSPEPVVTPRAREGLRAIVPTIFPPSTVNRGESVRVRPAEPPRSEHHLPPTTIPRFAADGFTPVPKKRGPKPKLRFQEALLSGPPRELVRRRVEEPLMYDAFKLTKHSLVDAQERDHEMRMNNLAQRPLHGQPSYRPNPMRLMPATGKQQQQQQYSARRSLHSHRPGLDAHSCRTKDYQAHQTPTHLKHLAHPGLYQREDSPVLRPPTLIAKIPISHLLEEAEEETCWSPCLGNLEKVVVTDVTSNFLTVTIKESTTDQGFFKDKR